MITKSKLIRKIAVKNIIFDKNQPRQQTRTAQLEDLARDIAERGQLYPIIVTQKGETDKFDLLDGERRVRAAIMNSNVLIEAMVYKADNRLEEKEVQAVANFKRVENKIEETALWLKDFKIQFALEHPDVDPIKRVIELTGYSRNYFESADAINRSTTKFKENIYSGKFGGYAAVEIEGVTKLPEMQQGLQEAYNIAVERKASPGALGVRPLKSKLRSIEQNEDYTIEQKKEAAKGLLLKKYNVLGDQDIDGKGNYLVYLETIKEWAEILDTWSAKGLSDTEMKHLTTELANLKETFMGKRKSTYGKPDDNPDFHLTR